MFVSMAVAYLWNGSSDVAYGLGFLAPFVLGIVVAGIAVEILD